MKLLTLIVSVLGAPPSFAADREPPPPPPASDLAAPSGPASAEGDDGPELLRYQACFQKMVDTGATDNAFMKKCLGIPTATKPALTPEAAAAVFAAAEPGLNTCYDKLLLAFRDFDKRPAGELAFTLTVVRGAVSAAQFDAGPSDAAFAACSRDRLRTLTFTGADGDPVQISAAWTLKATGKRASVTLLPRRVKVAAAAIGGEAAFAVFHQNAAKLHKCYDALLVRQPGASGRAAVTLLVSKGKVDKVGFRELTFGDEPFSACLAKELKTWRFPKGKGAKPVKVEYPALEFKGR